MDGLGYVGLGCSGTNWNLMEFVEMEILDWYGSNLIELCLLP